MYSNIYENINTSFETTMSFIKVDEISTLLSTRQVLVNDNPLLIETVSKILDITEDDVYALKRVSIESFTIFLLKVLFGIIAAMLVYIFGTGGFGGGGGSSDNVNYEKKISKGKYTYYDLVKYIQENSSSIIDKSNELAKMLAYMFNNSASFDSNKVNNYKYYITTLMCMFENNNSIFNATNLNTILSILDLDKWLLTNNKIALFMLNKVWKPSITNPGNTDIDVCKVVKYDINDLSSNDTKDSAYWKGKIKHSEQSTDYRINTNKNLTEDNISQIIGVFVNNITSIESELEHLKNININKLSDIYSTKINNAINISSDDNKELIDAINHFKKDVKVLYQKLSYTISMQVKAYGNVLVHFVINYNKLEKLVKSKGYSG
jgi:hypothetical protein